MADVIVEPRVLSFKQTTKGQTATRPFSIMVREPYKIKSVTIENKQFSLIRKSSDSTNNAEYELTFLGSQKPGRFSSQLRIEYTGTKKFHFIPVNANVIGNLRYAKNIYFTRYEDGFKPQNIVITSRSGKPITIKDIKDPDGKLKTEIKETTENRVRLEAKIVKPERKYKKPSAHSLMIFTSDKDEPEIEIKYTISDGIDFFREDKCDA